MALLQYKISSKALGTKTNLNVILPTPSPFELEQRQGEEFYKSNQKYQVLYLYHGTHGDSWDWLRFSRIESYAQKHRLAVVMPEVQNSSFHNIPNSYAYYDYVSRELPEIINWTFPISRKRENTFVAGLSMGGYGAFKVGMANPEIFGAVASLSGGFLLPERIEHDRNCLHAAAYGSDEVLTGTIEDPYWLAKQVVYHPLCPKLYLCVGTTDPLTTQCNRDFKQYLDSIGFSYTYHEQPGGHDWDFWDDEIRRVLEWLPLKHTLVDE
ncbi:esterase family protein [Pseudoflavonifractor sp. MSJ-30]|uniref:alpha/beta hydrolase n=1 Tax=Pseudoflavonifractor sp. MSJ-30 TaxID=2841525 RepID=UPI001C1091E2|nr:alpha/beta hydrolase family protein [Pseudoflavonifractor sp. MSJ-30]MBU5451717.1 esterase family protein [Pseudoflavonifractor sp. MSJ-30]